MYYGWRVSRLEHKLRAYHNRVLRTTFESKEGKCVPCHHGTVVDGANGLWLWIAAANILNNLPQTVNRGHSPARDLVMA
jgi:hypothetical protein